MRRPHPSGHCTPVAALLRQSPISSRTLPAQGSLGTYVSPLSSPSLASRRVPSTFRKAAAPGSWTPCAALTSRCTPTSACCVPRTGESPGFVQEELLPHLPPGAELCSRAPAPVPGRHSSGPGVSKDKESPGVSSVLACTASIAAVFALPWPLPVCSAYRGLV